MKKTKIIICGARGRMGSLIFKLAREKKNFEICGIVENKEHPEIGKEINGFTLSDNLSKIAKGKEVVIDFTVPSATMEFLKICKKKGNPIVIGTTGFSERQLNQIKKAGEKIPVFLSPNMSIGVNLFFKIIEYASGLLKNYETEITEIHHHFKKDAPSGTARKIASIICKKTGRNFDKVMKYGRKGLTGERSSEEIGVHSLRIGDITGEHYVYWGGKGEIIEISHRCYNREIFAEGALIAAEFLSGKRKKFYTMDELLKEVLCLK